jgi:hypothetical protein
MYFKRKKADCFEIINTIGLKYEFEFFFYAS